MAETFEQIVARNRLAAAVAPDHRADNSGLDDGPCLPGQPPRKKSAPRADLSLIRMRSWITRRERYGDRGHR